VTLLIRKHGSNVSPWEGEEVVGKEGEAVSCSKVKESLLWGAVCVCACVCVCVCERERERERERTVQASHFVVQEVHTH